MDAKENQMCSPDRPIQYIDDRSIIILNDGKRLIVVFFAERALRSLFAAGIESSAWRDFCT